ncbi:MAG: hypothetical protein N2112_01080 [Gemmataceae bacterium]|nr:hypothetical protein [Gemmataceae bacterium]
MNRTIPQPSSGNAIVNRTFLFSLLAVVLPLTTLNLAAPAERDSHGLAVKPYGWPSLLVVHFLAVLPLSLLIADLLKCALKIQNAIPFLMVGFLMCGIAFVGIDSLGEHLESLEVGFGLRIVIRTFVAIGLTIPFLMAARVGTPDWPRSKIAIIVGLVVAFLLPAIWAEKLLKENLPRVSDEISRGRLLRASHDLEGLNDLAPDRPFSVGSDSRTLSDLKKMLARDISKINERVNRAPKESAKWSEKIEYAADLIALDRLSEAERILLTLPNNPVALRRLSEVYQLQKRFAESDVILNEFLKEGLSRLDKPNVRTACVEAFDALANNAAEQRDYPRVEAILKEAIQKIPSEEAHFRYELGLHYKMRNRPFEAQREWNEALRLNPSLEPVIGPLLRNLKEHTPACLVGR